MAKKTTEDLQKRTIIISFDIHRKVGGKLCPFKEIKLKTKPVSLKRAHQIAKKEGLNVWPNFEYTIK